MAQTAESVYNQTHDPSGLVWVAHTGTDAVPNAVYAGKETNDRAVYVARAMEKIGVQNDHNYVMVGKFMPGFGMYFSFEGAEIKMDSFQVLTNPSNDAVQTKWALYGGRIPPTAVKAGFVHSFSSNRWDYIGRTKYQGITAVGDLVTDNYGERHLFYFMNGSEHCAQDFEILLAKNRHDSQCVMNFQLNCCASCTSYPKKKL